MRKKEVMVKLPDNYLKAYREIIAYWGYSDVEEFIEEEIKTFVKDTLYNNWDSLSKDHEDSRRIAKKIATRYKIAGRRIDYD